MIHTLTVDEPWDYPVLQRWLTLTVRCKPDEAAVYYGFQDGIAVAGYHYRHARYKDRDWSGGGCAPGRKWGEYRSQEEAILVTLLHLREQFKRPSTVKAIEAAIAKHHHPIQLTIF